MNHSILPKPVSLRKDLIFYFKMTDAGEGVPHLCPNSMAREVRGTFCYPSKIISGTKSCLFALNFT